MGDLKPTITPNGTEQPFGSDTEGENEKVMVSIMGALVNALLSFLTNDEGYVFNTNLQLKTREVNEAGKFKNQAAKHNLLGRMAKYMDINQNKITSLDLTVAGLSYLWVYFNDGQAPQRIAISAPMVTKILKSKSKAAKKFQRAAAAYVAFKEHQTLTISKREQLMARMSEKTRQNLEEIPEGMTLTSSVAASAFGMEKGVLIRHVIIEQPAMIRESFHHLRAELAKKSVSMIDNSGDRQRSVSREEYSEDIHLEVNALNLVEWFRESVFPTARYCSPCKKQFGVQQAAKGCPQCGNPKRNLGYNSNTAHLPFIESNEEGLKMVGGHRLLMKSFRFGKPAFNRLVLASKGLMAPLDALKFVMRKPVSVRKTMETVNKYGETETTIVWVKARLVPCWYEVPNSSGNRIDRFGLVVETMHIGDL